MFDKHEHQVRAWLERGQLQRARFAKMGWHELPGDEITPDPLFKHFDSRFMPGGKRSLPPPYTTWDVSHVTNTADLAYRKEMTDDLHRKCLPAMRRCDPNAIWFAIENINHAWYRLHLNETPTQTDEWPIELLPYADPCYLFAQDFSCGFIADLDRTISVFGRTLLDVIQQDLPLALTNIIDTS